MSEEKREITELDEKILKLADGVLQNVRNSLMVNLRYMDRAIGSLYLELVPDMGLPRVNGVVIWYDPIYALKTFQESREQLTREYLHMVLHCVYRHFFVTHLIDRRLWDLACDISVESTINDMNLPSVASAKAIDQRNFVANIRDKVRYLTAENIFRYLVDLDPQEPMLRAMEKLFRLCDHSPWYKGRVMATGIALQYNEDEIELPEPIQERWKKLSKEILMDIETFSKDQEEEFGDTFAQNLMALNREKFDYSAFLRKFTSPGEAMRINDDEFDYIFYTYGLMKYKKMPLVEPLEYKETRGIKDFVIAIDTSGSTKGDLVQIFLEKTYNMMMQRENFFNKINLHIIMCDAFVQERTKITNKEEFDRYLSELTILGGGGTDFRPVFREIDRLIDEGEFTDLKGMIYFTDGYGLFPSKAPDYQSAFIFVTNGFETPAVPTWAIKLVMNQEEIERM